MDGFTEEERAALKELAQDYQDNSVSRRAALSVLGAGAATGALGATALTGSATAQPTGNEGQVGTQSNRVEAWISEGDAQEMTIDKLSNTESGVVDFGTVSADSVATSVESFSQAFDSAPIVICTGGGTDSDPTEPIVWAQSISTSQFTYVLSNIDSIYNTYDHSGWEAIKQ